MSANARKTLAKFVLQIKLDEEMHEGLGAESFDAAQQLANDGDALFTQRSSTTMANYEKDITDWKRCKRRRCRFNDALNDALQAIDRRDAAPQRQRTLPRISVDPRIADRRSRATSAADHRAIGGRRPRQDAATCACWRSTAIQAPIPKRKAADAVGRSTVARCESDYRERYPRLCGFEAGDYDAAKRAFDARANVPAMVRHKWHESGRQRSTTNIGSSIRRRSDEADERWTDAVASYRRCRAAILWRFNGWKGTRGARADLDRKLNAALADPARCHPMRRTAT